MDTRHLRRAIELARDGMLAGRGGPFGAVVVRGDAVVGEGSNEVLATKDPTAHAEVVAIRAASRALGRFHLDDCVLYASCEPCPMCLSAAYWARIPRLVFAANRQDAAGAGFQDEELYAELARPPASRRIVVTQDLRSDAQRVFVEWARLEQRTLY